MHVSAIEKRFKIMRILFTSFWLGIAIEKKNTTIVSFWKINSPIPTKIELAV